MTSTSFSPWLLLHLLLQLQLLLCAVPAAYCQLSLGFTLQTSAAPWSARSTMQVELMTRAVTIFVVSGQNVAVAANSLILQGSTQPENDGQWHITASHASRATPTPVLSV